MFLNRITISVPTDVNPKYRDQYLNNEIGALCDGQKHGYANYRRLVKVEHVNEEEVVLYYESLQRFKVPSGMDLRITEAVDAKVDSGKGDEKVLATRGKGSKAVGTGELST